MKTPTESEISAAIARGLEFARKADAGAAITADELMLAHLAHELTRQRGGEADLFTVVAGAAKSPRLAWMEKHGIATAEQTLAGVPATMRWSAWYAAYPFEYERQYGCTEHEAIAKLAAAHGLKLWNEEGM